MHLTDRRLTLTATVLLQAAAAVYCGYALILLIVDFDGSFPIDLRLRWFEQHLMRAGIDPQTGGYSDPLTDSTHPTVRLIGSEYLPWSFGILTILVAPIPWQYARIYFGAATVGMLWMIATWARSLTSAEKSSLERLLPVVACFAMFPFAICISYGQMTVFVTAMLSACLLACKSERHALAGICLATACVKPHLASLFVLATLFQVQIRTLLVAGGVLLLASSATWVLADTNPIELILNSPVKADVTVSGPGDGRLHNRLLVFLANVIGNLPAVILLGSVVTAAWAVVVLKFRASLRIETVFALAAIAAMFLTYRKHYDVVLLSIPMAVLTVHLINRRTVALSGIWLLFGLTVWLPIRDTQWASLIVFSVDLIVWTVVAVFLVRQDVAALLPDATDGKQVKAEASVSGPAQSFSSGAPMIPGR